MLLNGSSKGFPNRPGKGSIRADFYDLQLLSNSTNLEFVADNTDPSTYKSLQATTPSPSSSTVLPDIGVITSSLPLAMTSSSLGLALPNANQPMETSVSLPASPDDKAIGFGLGLGLGIPLIIIIMLPITYITIQRRRSQHPPRIKATDQDPYIFEKPELDAEDTKTCIQHEPGELHNPIDAPYELEGNVCYHTQEIYNEQDLREVAGEIDGVDSIRRAIHQGV